jgi:hypothetical protein
MSTVSKTKRNRQPKGPRKQTPPNPNSKRSRRKMRAAPRNPKMATATGVHNEVYFSRCGRNYIRALADPWHADASVCVPSNHITTAATCSATVDFVIDVPVTGGYVVLDPQRSCFNDLDCVVGTNNTYATGGQIIIGAPLTQLVLARTNSQYSSTNLTATPDGVNYRVVASAMKIAYIGTALDIGGYRVALTDPNHLSLAGRTIGQMTGERKHYTGPIDRRVLTVRYAPFFPTDTEMDGNPIPAASDPGPGYTAPAHFYMGAILMPAKRSQFLVRVCTVFEINGKNITTGMKTSESDQNALGAGNRAATNSTPGTEPDVNVVNSYMESAKNIINIATSGVRTVSNIASAYNRMTAGVYPDRAYGMDYPATNVIDWQMDGIPYPHSDGGYYL